MSRIYDAVVVGSGPNGLAAAITLARNNLSVLVIESNDTVGGGVRTKELTTGFVYDVCSAVCPMAAASPFFQSLPLESYNIKWIQPEYALAHPLEKSCSIVFPGFGNKLVSSNNIDSSEWQSLFDLKSKSASTLLEDLLGPLRIPNNPFQMARFGIKAIQSANSISRKFSSPEVRALFGGVAAHSQLSFDEPVSAAAALALIVAGEVYGWPMMKRGSQNLSDGMLKYFLSLGGEIRFNHCITAIDEVPQARCVLFDLSAKQFASIAKKELPKSYLTKIEKFISGPGVFKIDWALSQPVPWKDELIGKAGTVHVGGAYDEIAKSEKLVSEGKTPEQPFVLLNQPSRFDESRAPIGKAVLWGYCHVPFGSTADMTDPIEAQIERFAPGFKDCILMKKISPPTELENYNRNYIGGDITGGAMNWKQLFSRPVSFLSPYRTPLKNTYLCSSSTPPGAGVHGMCGYYAAKTALSEVFKKLSSAKTSD